MKENIKVAESEVVLKGEVMFSNLKEARGFKESDEKKSFSITVKVSADNAEEVSGAIDNLEAAVFENAIKTLTPAQKKTAGKALPKYKFVADAAGEPTGEIRLELKRPEKFGTPLVRKAGEKDPVDRAYIAKGSTVVVRATVRPYKMGGTHGTAYTLKDIMILEEAQRTGGERKSSSELDKLMGAVDINDLPF